MVRAAAQMNSSSAAPCDGGKTARAFLLLITGIALAVSVFFLLRPLLAVRLCRVVLSVGIAAAVLVLSRRRKG